MPTGSVQNCMDVLMKWQKKMQTKQHIAAK